MGSVITKIRELFDRTRAAIRQEKDLVHESVRLIGRLDKLNAAVNLGIASREFPAHLGLTPDQYYKRLQAARVLERFPQFMAMLEDGRTHVAHVAMLASKITQANCHVIAANLPGMSKRELEVFLDKLMPDGSIKETEAKIEIRVTLSESEMALLDRAREILAACGHVPSTSEVFVKAMAHLVEARDPVRRAERAEERKKRAAAKVRRSTAPGRRGQGTVRPRPTVPAQRQPSMRRRRKKIPAATIHAVMLRDRGQCVEILADGRRCPERGMIEKDHRIMVCRGGSDAVDNIVLRCRAHNQAAARRELGDDYVGDHRRTHPSRRGKPAAR